jgi:hypothetical protein
VATGKGLAAPDGYLWCRGSRPDATWPVRRVAELPPAAEPYYQHECYLGDVPLPGVSHPPGCPVGLHLRLHVAEEAYRGRRELVPLRHAAGTRVYVHAKPYVLVPDYRLTVALTASRLAPGEPAGCVTDVAHRGWRRLDVGHGQAWPCPAEGPLIVWEAYLHDGHRADPVPARDPALALLWDGFEGALLEHLAPWGPARRLVTTWEDVYPRWAWAAFLEERGDLARPPAAFAKRLPPAAAAEDVGKAESLR